MSSGAPVGPSPCFPFPLETRGWSAEEAQERWRGVPGGRLRDARRAPRRYPRYRGSPLSGRAGPKSAGPSASPAHHRGTHCRRPHLVPSSNVAIDDALDEQGATKIRPDLRPGISLFSPANSRGESSQTGVHKGQALMPFIEPSAPYWMDGHRFETESSLVPVVARCLRKSIIISKHAIHST